MLTNFLKGSLEVFTKRFVMLLSAYLTSLTLIALYQSWSLLEFQSLEVCLC